MQVLPWQVRLPSLSLLPKVLPQCICYLTILASGSASGSTHLNPERKWSVCLKLPSMCKCWGLTIKTDPPPRAVCPLPQHRRLPSIFRVGSYWLSPHEHRPPPPRPHPVQCPAGPKSFASSADLVGTVARVGCSPSMCLQSAFKGWPGPPSPPSLPGMLPLSNGEALASQGLVSL